ncbi:MAG TPA: hypothetical protein VL593_12110 [Ramlibacter sp.]|nr:hypothetical protein [Ramlibacter sp.]
MDIGPVRVIRVEERPPPLAAGPRISSTVRSELRFIQPIPLAIGPRSCLSAGAPPTTADAAHWCRSMRSDLASYLDDRMKLRVLQAERNELESTPRGNGLHELELALVEDEISDLSAANLGVTKHRLQEGDRSGQRFAGLVRWELTSKRNPQSMFEAVALYLVNHELEKDENAMARKFIVACDGLLRPDATGEMRSKAHASMNEVRSAEVLSADDLQYLRVHRRTLTGDSLIVFLRDAAERRILDKVLQSHRLS